MLKYSPRQWFIPLHNRRQRWGVLCTHRRAGKTVALVNDIIFGALECKLHRPQLAYVGPTYSQARKIAWQYLKDFAEPYLSRAPQEAQLLLTLKNDAQIYCLGADNADSLRGMYLDGGVGDEYALFKPSVFSQVIRPALSDRNGWWLFASTPKGKNLFYNTYRTAAANPSEWFSLTLKASKSGILPPEELAALRKDMDPEEYAQEYECSFDAALKGAIYADEINEVFLSGRIKPGIYDQNLPTNVIYDLGFTDATVAIFWQEDFEGQIRIVRVIATPGRDIFWHIDQLNEFQGEIGDVWLPHDAKAKNLQTGKSVVEQFLSQNIRPHIVPMHKVRDRLAAARQMFPHVVFDEDQSDDLIEALKGYRREWDDKYLMFSDKPLHDWCSDYADAFGYMCIVASTRLAKKMSEPEQRAMGYNLNQLFMDYEDRRAMVGRRIR